MMGEENGNYFFAMFNPNSATTLLDTNTAKELFRKIARGDQRAFDELFHAQIDRIYSVALEYGKDRELAQDIAQQVFLQVWEKRETLDQVEHPVAWLHTAARYAIANVFDKQLVREKYVKRMLSQPQQTQASPEEIISTRQRQHLLEQAVHSLAGRQAEVYRLSREEGLTYAEIAVHLGIGKESVKEHMGAALKKLREFLLRHRDTLLSILLFFL